MIQEHRWYLEYQWWRFNLEDITITDKDNNDRW